jgi:hypothetical protein
MNKKYFLLTVFLLLVLVGIGAYFRYNKPTRDLTDKKADLSISAKELYKQFSENEGQANRQYLDKVVQVKGILTAVSRGEDGSLNLALDAGNPMGGVTCEMPAENAPEGANLQTGQQVTVKGQCTGILTDVLLVKCVLVP